MLWQPPISRDQWRLALLGRSVQRAVLFLADWPWLRLQAVASFVDNIFQNGLSFTLGAQQGRPIKIVQMVKKKIIEAKILCGRQTNTHNVHTNLPSVTCTSHISVNIKQYFAGSFYILSCVSSVVCFHTVCIWGLWWLELHVSQMLLLSI